MKRMISVLCFAIVTVLSGPVAADDSDLPDLDAAAEPTIKTLDDGIVSIEKGSFKVAFHARIQGWGGWVGNEANLDKGDLMQEAGFRLRRARLGLDGHVLESVTFALEMNLFDDERGGGPLQEAWIDWAPSHYIGMRMGVTKYPFMRSDIMSSRFLPHLDRPLGTFAMSPPNAMGLVIHSSPWEDRLTIELGVFNGLHRNEHFWKGYDGVGSSLGNRFEDQSFAGRMDLAPLGPLSKGMADPGHTRGARFAVGGGGFYNMGRTISTWGASGYAHLKARGLHVFAEFSQDHAEPMDKPTTTGSMSIEATRRVFNASLGYVFVKNMLGLAVRGEWIDADIDIDNEEDQWLIGGTLTWYAIGDYLKVQVEYMHRTELHGASVNNDWAIFGTQLHF
ncbi:MAG: porin [Pseudomonadota bacterium]